MCWILFSVSISVQSLSHVWLFATPWTAARQASLSIINSWEHTQTHVHWVSDAIQPTDPLLSPSPLLFNLSQHQGVFQWVNSSHQVAKVFIFSISPSKEYSGLISFRLVGSHWSPRDFQESSPTPQFKSINSSVLNFLYSPTLTSIHDYCKTIALTRWTFASQMMCLLFNMLSRFVIAFFPRSKHLLIS